MSAQGCETLHIPDPTPRPCLGHFPEIPAPSTPLPCIQMLLEPHKQLRIRVSYLMSTTTTLQHQPLNPSSSWTPNPRDLLSAAFPSPPGAVKHQSLPVLRGNKAHLGWLWHKALVQRVAPEAPAPEIRACPMLRPYLRGKGCSLHTGDTDIPLRRRRELQRERQPAPNPHRALPTSYLHLFLHRQFLHHPPLSSSP